MNSELYELIATGARYFFVVLMALIVYRAFAVTVKDARRAGSLRRWSPETGLMGELVVLEGSGRAQRGSRYPIIREGTVGSSRTCDVRIRHNSVHSQHAQFEMTDEGFVFTAKKDAPLLAENGERARKILARDGDTFTLGQVAVMLVLFDAEGSPDRLPGQEMPARADDAWFETPDEGFGQSDGQPFPEDHGLFRPAPDKRLFPETNAASARGSASERRPGSAKRQVPHARPRPANRDPFAANPAARKHIVRNDADPNGLFRTEKDFSGNSFSDDVFSDDPLFRNTDEF